MSAMTKRFLGLAVFLAMAAAPGAVRGDVFSDPISTGGDLEGPLVGTVVMSIALPATSTTVALIASGPDKKAAEKADERTVQAAQLYLRHNGVALFQDLALGRGPVVDELAAAAGVLPQHRARFMRLLRAHRVELLGLADSRTLTPERALRFFSRVGDILQSDGALAEDLRAARRRLEG